jgi:uncharacterized protein YjgD (DUF1641 family)
MMGLLTNILPILGGFLMKLFALNQQAKQEQQTQMLDVLAARSQSIQEARDTASKESPMAALNRRVIIFVILALVVFTQIAPVIWNVETVVPTVREGFSLLGIQVTADEVEYVTVKGMLKLNEVFEWATLIIEFYFGAQLAKGK